MKNTAILIALATAACLSAQEGPGRHGGPGGFGPGGFGPAAAWPGSRVPVTGAPYSGVQITEIQQTLANGNQITRKEQSKVYRDGQGRIRIERVGGEAASRSGVTIFDAVAGESYFLNPSAKTAVKGAMGHPGPGGPGGARGQHAVEGGPRTRPEGQQRERGQREDLGTQTINGVPAKGTRHTETIPAGAIGNQQAIQVVREMWISTTLRVPVLIKTNDPRFGTTTMQLTDVSMAEPDPTLFRVPADFNVTERSGPPQDGAAPRGRHRQ